MKQYLISALVDAGRPLSEYMVHRGRVAHGIFDNFAKPLLTRCNHYPMATLQGGRRKDSVVFLQSQWLHLRQSEVKATRRERRGGEEINISVRKPLKRLNKKIEAIRDSACAALAA